MAQADLPLAGDAEKRTDLMTDAILLVKQGGSRNSESASQKSIMPTVVLRMLPRLVTTVLLRVMTAGANRFANPAANRP